MREGGVNHAVGDGHADAQAFQIFESSAVNLGTGGDEGVGARVGAGKTVHLMARLLQIVNNR